MTIKSYETDDAVRNMLQKLSVLWKNRAAVKQELPDYNNLAFDPNKADFSECLGHLQPEDHLR
jgi:hypothetical protein